MEATDFTVHRVSSRDLHLIPAVISSAVETWPTSARLKRNVLPVLAYKEQDLLDHEILLVTHLRQPVAVGAWQTDAGIPDPDQHDSALLHGLFVSRDAQTRGLGRWLQATIARRAQEAGFHGLHVKAERFARDYFVQCGYRILDSEEQPGAAEAAYPHWLWQACSSIATTLRTAGTNPKLTEPAESQLSGDKPRQPPKRP